MLNSDGYTTMMRDWLLTLLVVSPSFLAATIVILALIRGPMKRERMHRAVEAGTPRSSRSDERGD